VQSWTSRAAQTQIFDLLPESLPDALGAQLDFLDGDVNGRAQPLCGTEPFEIKEQTLLLGLRYRPGRAAFKPGETVTSGVRYQCLSMSDGSKLAGSAQELSGSSRYCSISGGSTV
jgi:hypothetical protein